MNTVRVLGARCSALSRYSLAGVSGAPCRCSGARGEGDRGSSLYWTL